MSMLGGFGGGSGMGQGGSPKGSSAIAFVTEREFEREVIQSELPVLIEFTSDRFPACRQVAPEVDAFANEMVGKVKTVKVDIEKAPLLVRELRVQSVPTFMVFAEQRIVDAQMGVLSRKQLRGMVEPFLPRQAGALKARELFELMKQGAVVPVDTRDAAAFARAHIPGAKNMPLEEIEGRLAELYMLAGQPVLYCRAGDKTKELSQKLDEQGVPAAFIEGGFLSWEAEGLGIERGAT